jgi:hypothetical protein
MSEQMPSKEQAYEMAYEDNKAMESMKNAIASQLHEDWRKTRLNEDGTYEPRLKNTSDQEWISAHDGLAEVDIANTTYENLPADWQAENATAGEVVATELVTSRRNGLDITPKKVEEIASIVHDKWLERNEWAKGGELDVPYEQLPEDEKAKDRDQVMIGLATLNGLEV